MKAIIFGANGQDGYYLSELCKTKCIEPIGISRSGDWIKGDVSSYEQVLGFIKKYRPQYIFHFAANSTTRHDLLFENYDVISKGTINILEAVKACNINAKVFITGSGVQFENKGKPISEKDQFEANSLYSVARIHSVYAARYYRALGLPVYVGYLFHHESPYRKLNHASQAIALAVKRIANGSREKIELGNISVKKEWTFAGDIVRGIFTLIEQNDVFEVVIGSGIAYSIEEWLKQCFKLIGRSWNDYVIIKDDFIPEYKCLVSNPTVIKSLGWSPQISFEELASMMVSQNIKLCT